jgi:NAD(P)-dependent dehydrogenase (short-subunit alcohol dehydrogenase family)
MTDHVDTIQDRKLALLTGAAGEVGRAAATRFAEAGWSVLMCDRVPEVEQLAEKLATKSGRPCFGVTADLTTDEGIGAVIAAAAATGIPLGFLGLIAAINHRAISIEAMDMAVWDRVQNINVRANVHLISRALPLLRKAKDPSIVLVSSFWGREGHAFFSAYCASKAAMISLTQSIAAELAPDIRVNGVAPGNINTPMHFDALAMEAKARGISEEEMRASEWNKIPMRRPAETAEIASAIHFLSTKDAGYFIGATLDVNGGCRFT